MKLSGIKVLNGEEILRIHRSSLEILAEVGILLKSRSALEFLESKGLLVDYDKSIVRFDPNTVNEAIASTPKEFKVYSMDYSYNFIIGQGNPQRIAAGHNGLYLYDYKSGKRNPFTKEEVARFAQLADNLDEVDVVATQAYPQDVNSKSCFLHGAEALLTSTLKPFLLAPEKNIEIKALIEIIKIASGVNKISDKPIGIVQFSPSSPLFWNSETIDGFITIAKEGFPCVILPGVLSGATAPYSIAGALVQKNAEILAGITIGQLVNKGTPLIYRNGGNRLEMRRGVNLLGTPESFLFCIAGNQMAQHYKIPTHGCTPDSDSPAMDEQTAIENMFSLLSGFESGTDLMVNIGMFGSGKVSSYEQGVIDNEMVKLIRRYMKGIEISEKSLMVDAIKRVGPMGNYLGDISTLENLKSGEFTDTDVFNRTELQTWVRDGCKTVTDNASLKAQKLLLNETRTIIDKDKSKGIKEIIEKFEKDNK
jgi:trimethylamine---corrinoid protein Co-methyltransferase